MERVEWISIMHKQNLNGRETEDELFEAGILAGIEETEAIMYSAEDIIDINFAYLQYLGSNQGSWINFKEWFKQFKKK